MFMVEQQTQKDPHPLPMLPIKYMRGDIVLRQVYHACHDDHLRNHPTILLLLRSVKAAFNVLYEPNESY